MQSFIIPVCSRKRMLSCTVYLTVNGYTKMLLVFCGFLTLAAAATHNHKIIYSRNDGETVTAVSFIRPNSKPPSGTETPVYGTIKMMQTAGQEIIIAVNISGLPSDTVHGFHIHEFGDTVTDGCQSTGGHYNPFQHTHGAPDDKNRHVGDLGNVKSDERGRIVIQFNDTLVSLFGPNSVFGRAFVIHQKRDDLGRGNGAARAESLKTGNAGARLGCGVIFHDKPIEIA